MCRHFFMLMTFLLEYLFFMRVSMVLLFVFMFLACACFFCVYVFTFLFLCMCLYFFYVCVLLLRFYVQVCLCVFSCHFTGIHITFMCLSMFLLFVRPCFLSSLICLSASLYLCFFSMCVSVSLCVFLCPCFYCVYPFSFICESVFTFTYFILHEYRISYVCLFLSVRV